MEAGNLRTRAINAITTDWDQKQNYQVNISSLNVRSLQQHLKDLRADEFIIKSDILCVQETWLDSDPDEHLLGYHAYYLHGRSRGIALFTRLSPVATQNFQSDTCSIIKSSFENCDIWVRPGTDQEAKVMRRLRFPPQVYDDHFSHFFLPNLLETKTKRYLGVSTHHLVRGKNSTVCGKKAKKHKI